MELLVTRNQVLKALVSTSRRYGSQKHYDRDICFLQYHITIAIKIISYVNLRSLLFILHSQYHIITHVLELEGTCLLLFYLFRL